MRQALRLSTLGLSALLAYLLLAFNAQPWTAVIAMLVIILTCVSVPGTVMRRLWLTSAVRRRIGSYAWSVLITLIALDIVFTASMNAQSPAADEQAARLSDAHLLINEIYPRLYYPTERNFRLQKSGYSVTATHYGEYYSSELIRLPTLSRAVFELKHVSISIDDGGFRNTIPISDACVFALGDSFTFGWGVDQGLSWPAQLSRLIGEPVYNLGVHDASPYQELMLLDYLLHKETGRPKICHLLWMIYEGNDLEDSYATLSPAAHGNRPRAQLWSGTVIQGAGDLLRRLQEESVLHRLFTGELTLHVPGWQRDGDAPAVVDGVRTGYRLYYSSRFGYVLIHPSFIDRACQPRSYVMDHPNRPRLEQVFKDMSALAQQYSFDVTVIVAPTSVRLYAPYLNGFSRIEPPYFIDYTIELAKRSGFSSIDLLALMRPAAAQEFLYFRDDDHWNVRGYALAAQLIADRMALRAPVNGHEVDRQDRE
jgi:hypothetical protein